MLNSFNKTLQKRQPGLAEEVEYLRKKANALLDPMTKAELGQFFTSNWTSKFMASMFNNMNGDIRLLEPGAGVGSLVAAFVDEVIQRNSAYSLSLKTYEIGNEVQPFLQETLHSASKALKVRKINFSNQQNHTDFILAVVKELSEVSQSSKSELFTHVIMNPPYKKIKSTSLHKLELEKVGISAVNLYSGFVSLAIKLLKPQGELVALIPRSFCNGTQYKAFRDILLNETSINRIHLFDRRDHLFSDDKVLQENVIIHCTKSDKQGDVSITSKPNLGSSSNENEKIVSSIHDSKLTVPFKFIVNETTKQRFIHILTTKDDQKVVEKLSVFKNTLDDIQIKVSTGPVVDFRLKKHLRKDLNKNSVPLLYPLHLNEGLTWPKKSKKPNAISVNKDSIKWLFYNRNNFVITKRFSSKEEKRRIVAYFYDSCLPGDWIGFDNKLNIFHLNKHGFEKNLAKGLFVYLNSTLLDQYYRQFGGHTQVNVSDLKSFPYPPLRSLQNMGKKMASTQMAQDEIDEILDHEISFLQR